MRRFALGLFAAAAISGAGPLLAEEEGDLFTKLDANKDGFVTADEIDDNNKAKFERQLRNADKDGDKKLSKDEFAASLKPDDAPKQPLGARRRRETRDRFLPVQSQGNLHPDGHQQGWQARQG